MTNDQRRRLEDAILAYGEAAMSAVFASIGGSETQEALARCAAADRWLEVQDALDAMEEAEIAA